MTNIPRHNVPTKLLEGLSVNKLQKLSKFLVLKAAFPRSIIYDYSAYKLANYGRVPWSRNKCNAVIQSLIKEE